MTTWPAIYTATTAPTQVVKLAGMVIPQLLVGDHRAIAALRAQYDRSRIATVEMTGVGFFVNYDVPDDIPPAVPSDFAGGTAEIHIAGLDHPAGCVLFVRAGHLSMLEVYIVDKEWPDDDTVLSVERITPLLPPAQESSA